MGAETPSAAETSPGPGAAQHPPSRPASRLPQARRGYDVVATDALLAELAEKQAELETECARLRDQVAGFEREAAREGPREELVGKALIAATSFAMKTRESARREAELILRSAAAKADDERALIAQLAREREEAEQELERLRQLANELRSGLAGFLTHTLSELHPGAEREHEEAAPAPAVEPEPSLTSTLEAALRPESS